MARARRRLGSREAELVREYLIDGDARRAAVAVGYPDGAWGERVLRRKEVWKVIEEELEKRRQRLAINPERIMTELARIAFSNGRDFFPGKGQILDLQRLDIDKTAAVAEFQLDEAIDPDTGRVYRRTKVRLYDKLAALRDLARCIGMMREEHTLTLEVKIKEMTPQERVDMAWGLLEKGRQLLPAYEKAVARGEIVEAAAEEREEGAT